MFNRTDGFDTFAHSAGLEREFIERDLAVAYQNKLNKGDLAAVRRGEISPVYSQFALRTGRIVQSCTTYLPLDYTGERSSYLTHSLVFEGDEVREVFCNENRFCFNHDMFVKDIDGFALTSPATAPNPDYPELKYIAENGDTRELVGKYSEDTLKAFIYAMFATIKGRGKSVFFRLPYSDEELSGAALDFLNRIITVIPYDMRDALSFVTYITDYTQYPTYKLKCVSEKCGEMNSSRNIFIDLQTGLVSGISESDLASGRTLMNFFYMLLESKDTRNEFLDYMEHAVQVMPSLDTPAMKVLTELVFLFCAVCGNFAEEAILPNDTRVYELFCIYEKYRAILSEEYRMEAYKCLQRYPRSHVAIPKNIFAKVTKLYADECSSAKRVAMNAVLDLIHTDIMREKLFAFIRANYATEDDDIKAAVNSDLCRVFYGGFLQPQIIDFFSVNFTNTPEETKDLILEKLLLTVRTAAIQQKVLDFISMHYDDMSESQKEKVYDTFFEMLPECDSLASAFCKTVDCHIETESENLKKSVRERIISALEADYNKKNHLLMPILASGNGFCREQVISLALGEWSNRKISVEYLALLSTKKMAQKTEEIAFVLSNQSFDGKVKEKLLKSIVSIYSENTDKATLYDWLDADDRLAAGVDADSMKMIRESVIYPAVEKRLYDVFKSDLGKDGIRKVECYCTSNNALLDTDKYKAISAFEGLCEAISSKSASGVAERLLELDSLGVPRNHLAPYILLVAREKDGADLECNMLCEISAMLVSGKLNLEELYSTYAYSYTQQYLIERGAKADLKKGEAEGATLSVALLWRYVSALVAIDAERLELLTSGFEAALVRFAADYGKGAEKWAELNMPSRPDCFVACFTNAFGKSKNQSGGFFSRLFGKK